MGTDTCPLRFYFLFAGFWSGKAGFGVLEGGFKVMVVVVFCMYSYVRAYLRA